ncbi:baculoviral IAP repeat-containing protein 5a [Brachyhypopomus gauderio]|uniref:baculoviral IAP repeat-containing protein 5a n=1 Tax=Brachyhypopomus gauderio TaxID=698409 RepID=UPI004042FD27
MDLINDDHMKMYFYESRLLTFAGWPFEEDCVCTPENMAKAGFVHTPSDNSPDIAQCFFCLKELEGWEPEDDPEKEHKLHSPNCNFITLKKSVESLTVEEILRLQKERQKFVIKKTCNQAIAAFEESVKLKRGQIIQTAMDEE